MIEIKSLLLRWNNFFLSETIKKELIQKTIKENTNLDVKDEEIEIKNNTIVLNIKPIYKNEIFLKKEKILLDISNALGKKSPTDIR